MNVIAIEADTIDQTDDAAEQQRLMALFSNRTALKKSFEDLRAERRLQDERLDASRTEIDALRAKLEYVESLLTDDEKAPSTVLFYHLRGLSQRLSLRLEQRAQTLSRRIEGKRRAEAIENWQQSQKRRIARVVEKIDQERSGRQRNKDDLADLVTRLDNSQRIWWFWRRRHLEVAVLDLQDELQARTDNLAALTAHHKKLRRATPSAGIGLTVADKRMINLRVLALAQFLFAHFSADDLVRRMRLVYERDLGAVDYGSIQNTLRLLKQAKSAERGLLKEEGDAGCEALVERQACHLQKIADYSHEDACMPEGFLVHVPDINEDSDVFVITDQFALPATVIEAMPWKLADVLLG